MNGYRSELNHYLLSKRKQLFFYWKGRVALYALLKAMDVQPNDEIILPAYTCVVVPNAILYLGAKPVYVDISRKTFNMDVNKVESAITSRTKVIICQNTYGLSSDLEKLVEIARRHHLFTLEDCTHGFGGQYNGKPNGSFCDTAFFSTQWNKPFSTGIGGFSVTRNVGIARQLELLEQELVQPSFKELVNLKVLYWVRRYLLTERTYWSLVSLYRFLSKHNIVVGSSSGEEITSTRIPEGYFKAFSQIQAKEGMRNIAQLPDLLKVRKQNARRYSDFLMKHGKTVVADDLVANHSFLKYPLLVKDRGQFMHRAEDSKIELGDWFTSPLHPVEGDLTPWYFEPERYPVATEIARHVVNLPTTPSHIDRVMAFLDRYLDEIT